MVKKRVSTPDEREAKRQHILAIAAREFAEYGFDSAQIDVIADKAGVGKGTMYRYAASKEDLFQQVLAESAKRVQVALDQALRESEGQSAKELVHHIVARLQTLEKQYPDFIAVQNSTIYGVMHRRFRGTTADTLHGLATQLEAIFARKVSEGQIRPIDVHRMSLFLTGQLHTFGRVTDLFGEPSPDPGAFMSDLFWNGLKPD